MAKITGPLLSITARGSFGPRLTFSQRQSGQQVRIQKKQGDVITTKRTTQRGRFTEGYEHWNTLTGAEKSQWTTFTKG
jgi:hypothetical protein